MYQKSLNKNVINTLYNKSKFNQLINLIKKLLWK